MNYKKIKMPPIVAYSLKGKFLVFILRLLYSCISLFWGINWRKPLKNFEESPAFFAWKDILYLGYKYYFRPPFVFPSATIQYFKNQNVEISSPSDFKEKTRLTISAGGDLMPYEWIQKQYTQNLWDEVGDFFFSADIVFANLETPIYLKKPASLVPEVMLSDMLFNANAEMFEIFSGNGQYKGYDILSTANNHSLDMGEEGLIATIEFLEQQKIAFVGTARSPEERQNPPIIEKNGIKIAFLAYTFSLNQFLLEENKKYLANMIRLNIENPDLEEIKRDVLNVKHRDADLVVLSLHIGNAYQAFPSEHIISTFHRVFEECGVDIILGSHPHNPQPMEIYEFSCPFKQEKKKGFAIYSLADFVAYDIFVWDRLVPLLKLHISKGELNGKPHTQLSEIEVLPVFNCGIFKSHTKKEMRFLDLEKLINSMEKHKFPSFLEKKHRKEAQYLYQFAQKIGLKKRILGEKA